MAWTEPEPNRQDQYVAYTVLHIEEFAAITGKREKYWNWFERKMADYRKLSPTERLPYLKDMCMAVEGSLRDLRRMRRD